MLSKSDKIFSIIFSSIVIIELIFGSNSSYEQFHYISKPAIVVSLLIFFWMNSNALHAKLRRLIAMALTFSLFGDLLLMFVSTSQTYFLLGLVSFLIAHVIYVIAFLKDRNSNLKPYVFIIVLLIYASGLFYLLKDGLNDMLIPVIIYMIVILSMATSAFLRCKMVSKVSYLLVFTGAILFMLSDSILALNKFYQPLAYANVSIMLTYALAQFLIVLGILKQDQHSR
ncbi:lysoplasmalogenase [uncultured Psychroserpens sp.]|uniref:lysoplasmalogenase n=1 Tax=uncultured Psychroserpens sp. TaxID=255436 RepID=UPI002625E5F8|nr:lysoplasmalogenase [uncultured Psychroserpens sp.]